MSDQHNRISAAGESSRTPEFKQAREGLIKDNDEFLNKMRELRDSLTAPKGGYLLLDTPRVTATDMGLSGPITRMIGEEAKQGIALLGDGVAEPLIFQSCKTNPNTGERELIIVQGSDPLAKQLGHEYSLSRQTEGVMSLEVRTRTSPKEAEYYFKFEVRGDGGIYRSYLDTDGTHVSRPVYKADEVGGAQAALRQIEEAYLL